MVEGEGEHWGRSLLEGLSSMPTVSLRVEVTVIVGAWVGSRCAWLEPAAINEGRAGAKTS